VTHLGYCLNVHPTERLDELLTLLRGPVARVRAGVGGERPLGVGLWLPQAVVAELEAPGALATLRATLDEARLYAFTVNAFPIGGFHAERVKREVYRPTWLDPARRDYTVAAARVLAGLLPDGARGSLSTVPVSYSAFGDVDLAPAGTHLGQVALELERLSQETGHDLALALEPEPLATLETGDEAIAFLEGHVFAGAGRVVVADAGASEPEALLRRRIGACVDTCHHACVFEDLEEVLAGYARAGVRVVKAQLSAALALANPAQNAAGVARLAEFHEPRYLHQTNGWVAGQRVRLEDLDELLVDGALSARLIDASQLRTHFHVPLCWEGDALLDTTRPTLEVGLGALAAATDHLEVETYTFDVLPAADRARYGDDVVNMLVAELRWAAAALASRGVAVE